MKLRALKQVLFYSKNSILIQILTSAENHKKTRNENTKH